MSLHDFPFAAFKPLHLRQIMAFRYSREEMIALFVREDAAPAGLDSFTAIFRAAIDAPMAFRPITEAEKVQQTLPHRASHS